MATFSISAFGDEIAVDLADQLAVLNELEIDGLDLRTAWGVNIAQFSDEQARRARAMCDDAGVSIVCLGSPIGKSPLADPIQIEIDRLKRIAEIAGIIGVTRIRIFSFYPDDISSNAHYDQYVDETIDRLGAMTAVAKAEGLILLHENEKEIVGDTPERNLRLAEALDGPHFRLIWDPANYVQVGAAEQVDAWWDRLSPYLGYVHIKDAVLSDGSIRAAGEGDGQIDALLSRLAENGYAGPLALEPHLVEAAHSTGYSGPEGMAVAVTALRGLIDQI